MRQRRGQRRAQRPTLLVGWRNTRNEGGGRVNEATNAAASKSRARTLARPAPVSCNHTKPTFVASWSDRSCPSSASFSSLDGAAAAAAAAPAAAPARGDAVALVGALSSLRARRRQRAQRAAKRRRPHLSSPPSSSSALSSSSESCWWCSCAVAAAAFSARVERRQRRAQRRAAANSRRRSWSWCHRCTAVRKPRCHRYASLLDSANSVQTRCTRARRHVAARAHNHVSLPAA